MGKFDSIAKQLEDASSLTKLSEEVVAELRKEFPSVESDYFEFLVELGYGDLGDIQLYSGPSSGNMIYGQNIERLKEVMIFGDDMQGYCFGFDSANSNRVVEIDPQGNIDTDGESSFVELLGRYFGTPRPVK